MSDPRSVDPVAFAQSLGITPEREQARLLSSLARRVILCCHRQWGKSTMVALLVLHTAIYQPGSLVLVVSRSERQAKLLLDKVRQLNGSWLERSAGSEGGGGRRPTPRRGKGSASDLATNLASDASDKLIFTNASEVLSVPASDNIRGYSAPAMIILDEASRIDDYVWAIVTPMMLRAPRCRFMLMSTPNGRVGEFYRTWRDTDPERVEARRRSGGALSDKEAGRPTWYRLRVRLSDRAELPDYMKAAVEEDRARMPGWQYEQEYECDFTNPEGALFDMAQVERAIGGASGLVTGAGVLEGDTSLLTAKPLGVRRWWK